MTDVFKTLGLYNNDSSSLIDANNRTNIAAAAGSTNTAGFIARKVRYPGSEGTH
jgi:hypothetical protein